MGKATAFCLELKCLTGDEIRYYTWIIADNPAFSSRLPLFPGEKTQFQNGILGTRHSNISTLDATLAIAPISAAMLMLKLVPRIRGFNATTLTRRSYPHRTALARLWRSLVWWSRNTTARLWCALLGWCHHARARTWRALSWKSCIFMRLIVARNHRIRRRGCCGLLRARSCRPPPWKWPSRQVSKQTHHFMSGLLYSCFFLIWIQSFLLNFLFSTPRQLRRLIFIHLWSSSMHLVVGILLDSPTLRHHGTKFINICCRHIVGSLDILGPHVSHFLLHCYSSATCWVEVSTVALWSLHPLGCLMSPTVFYRATCHFGPSCHSHRPLPRTSGLGQWSKTRTAGLHPHPHWLQQRRTSALHPPLSPLLHLLDLVLLHLHHTAPYSHQQRYRDLATPSQKQGHWRSWWKNPPPINESRVNDNGIGYCQVNELLSANYSLSLVLPAQLMLSDLYSDIFFVTCYLI